MDFHSNFELDSSLDVSIPLIDTLGYILHSLRVPLNSMEAACKIIPRSNNKNDREYAINLIKRVYDYFDFMVTCIEKYTAKRIENSNVSVIRPKAGIFDMFETTEIDSNLVDISPEILLTEFSQYLREKNEILKICTAKMSHESTLMVSVSEIEEITANMKRLLDTLKNYLLKSS